MLMPSASAKALESAAGSCERAAMEKASPRLIPSGMLCSVTALTKSVVRSSLTCGPSGVSESGCICGVILSKSATKATPRMKPPVVGSHWFAPFSCACSMAGIKSDQMLAAIMMPAAKPMASGWNLRARCCDIGTKTTAAPRAVAAKERPVPKSTAAMGPDCIRSVRNEKLVMLQKTGKR